MSKIHVLKHFLRDPSTTGTLLESSARLSGLITDLADLSQASVVVELGPGTGVVTKHILHLIPPQAQFLALEINPDFVRATQTRCPGTRVFHSSATEIPRCLARLGLQACDRIIAGLPWTFLAPEVRNEVLQVASASLAPGGKLVTFSYVHGFFLPSAVDFRKRLSHHFSTVKAIGPVWRNFPPAIVYIAES